MNCIMEAYRHSPEQTYLFLVWINQCIRSNVIDSYIRAISKGFDFRVKKRSKSLPSCELGQHTALEYLAVYVRKQRLQKTPLFLAIKDLDLMVDISYYESLSERLIEIYERLGL